MSTDAAKKAAAYAAADAVVRPGMRLGMGTGSTAAFVLERVAELYREGKLDGLLVVPTSLGTEWSCLKAGLPVVTLSDPRLDGELDVAMDGADAIDPDLNLIKGGGGALLTEKIIARAAKKFIVVADAGKLQSSLGTGFPLPLEVLPSAVSLVLRELKALGTTSSVRHGAGKAGPIMTDSGHLLVDVVFPGPIDPAAMEARLDNIPGILETGLFVGMARQVFIGEADGTVRVLP